MLSGELSYDACSARAVLLGQENDDRASVSDFDTLARGHLQPEGSKVVRIDNQHWKRYRRAGLEAQSVYEECTARVEVRI
jgi:hypothetical protein